MKKLRRELAERLEKADLSEQTCGQPFKGADGPVPCGVGMRFAGDGIQDLPLRDCLILVY